MFAENEYGCLTENGFLVEIKDVHLRATKEEARKQGVGYLKREIHEKQEEIEEIEAEIKELLEENHESP
jgi:hypothetical protein